MGRPHLRRQCRLEDQRRDGPLLPREGQGWQHGKSQREAVHQHQTFKAAAGQAGAEAGAGAAGCKLSDTAGGEAGKAGREAGGADDAMDVE